MTDDLARPETAHRAAVVALGQIGRPHTVRDGRTAEGAADLRTLDRLLIAALREQAPASVRNVFYRAVDPSWPVHVEKSEDGYRLVARRLLKLRRSGAVPYPWVADHTRRAHRVDTFEDLDTFAAEVAGLYRADVWGQHGRRVELWLESRSMVGAVERLCRELAVDLYPCGGQPSETFVYEAAESLARSASKGLQAIVLYIGDYDGPGLVIARSVEDKLRGFAPSAAIEWRHLGVNADMIERYGLPTRPHKNTNLRGAPPVAVEAEALPAAEWRRIVRREVEALLPPGAFKVARIAEEAERATFVDRVTGAAP